MSMEPETDLYVFDIERREQQKKCTAVVSCVNGIITTKSCVTNSPLIDLGGCSDGCCDYYECPDCGKFIKICYEE